MIDMSWGGLLKYHKKKRNRHFERKNMNEYMNEPIERIWIPEDVVNTYKKLQDKAVVAKIFCIPVKQVTKILNDNK